ncbi:protein impact [Anaeramoeba flamelloides]|uniref:Protein impact n=1 Tax=Anaeramoeba flamelloides TaxID=1746091 RepID=A0AAV8A845_9EUKA|nr:protein impact [Anaeramoeba flamelloides]
MTKRSQEEIEMIQAIYEEEFNQVSSNTFQLQIGTLIFNWGYPSDYPQSCLTNIKLSNLGEELKTDFNKDLKNIFQEANGEPYVYTLVEFVREKYLPLCDVKQNENKNKEDESQNQNKVNNKTKSNCPKKMQNSKTNQSDQATIPTYYPGQLINDRKSKFLSHVAITKSMSEVDLFLKDLTSKKKYAQATHNIVVYRILNQTNNSIILSGDEDGEKGALSRLTFWLEKKQFLNICIIVTRWKEGPNLGGDRFKDILKSAISAVENNLHHLESAQQSPSQNEKQNNKPKRKKKKKKKIQKKK